MRVPVSVTISALTPSGLPTSFTRSMNAGGKENSRPHSRPTFIGAPSRPGGEGVVALDMVGARRLVDAVARFRDDRLDDGTEVSFLCVDAQLPIGARAVGENRPHVLRFPA